MKSKQLIRRATLAAALFAVSAVASANEVIATVVPGAKGSPTAIGLDMASAGNVAGFSFRIDVKGVKLEKANLSGCVNVKGFTGACSVAKGSVYVYAVADRKETVLPAGVTSIGKIFLPSTPAIAKAAAGGLKVEITELSSSDPEAQSLDTTARVEAN
jgi:hypothetical protein